MPNSLRSRLKNLVYKGILSQKDLDRIVIVPVDGTGDLISRQAAIDCLTATKLKKFDFILQAREEIKNLPSVSTEETNWIPVGARLPSDCEQVIVSVLDDHGDTPWKYTTVAWLCNGVWISDNDILCGTAVAWMPLPQPYKGESEE